MCTLSCTLKAISLCALCILHEYCRLCSCVLSLLQANRGLRELREIAKGITKQLPEGFQEVRSLVVTFQPVMSCCQRLAKAPLKWRVMQMQHASVLHASRSTIAA